MRWLIPFITLPILATNLSAQQSDVTINSVCGERTDSEYWTCEYVVRYNRQIVAEFEIFHYTGGSFNYNVSRVDDRRIQLMYQSQFGCILAYRLVGGPAVSLHDGKVYESRETCSAANEESGDG